MIHIRDLNVRDPFIVCIVNEKKYILYSNKNVVTNDEKPAIVYFESDDLVWWTEAKIAYQSASDFWGPLDFWAPEVHYWKGRYYLFCSYRSVGSMRGCQCHVSDSPRGPFMPVNNFPVTPSDWHSLDGTLYEDPKGNPWMVFCHEWPQVEDGQMVAIQLSEDLGKAVSEPVILFRGSEAPWKGHPGTVKYPQAVMWGRVTDGPFLYRAKNGELLMLWSSFSDTGYTVGYARSASGSVLGPWIQEEEPLYSQNGGHAMLFTTFGGKLIMALHSPNINGRERLLFFEMEDTNGRLHIINELTGNWLINRYNEDGTKKV